MIYSGVLICSNINFLLIGIRNIIDDKYIPKDTKKRNSGKILSAKIHSVRNVKHFFEGRFVN